MNEGLRRKAEDFFKRFYRVFDDELEYAKENNDEDVINTIKMLVEFAEETTKEIETQNKRLESDCNAYNYSQHSYQETIKELEVQISKMKADVISERDDAKHLEDVISYTVLNNILEKWGIK